jgi:hypothetical protein
MADAIVLLTYLFARGEAPPCLDAADADDDGGHTIGDGIHLLQYLSAGGPDLPPPSRGCGIDPTPDPLTCRRYEACR